MNRYLLNKVLKGFMLCLPLVAGTAEAAIPATVNVYPDEKGQKVGGIGGGIVYYQDWLTNHPYRDAVLDTLFNGLGISCLRMGNWAIEDIESDNVVVNNDAIIYKAAKERCGEDLKVLMSSWTPPASLKACNSRNGSNYQGKASLKKVWGQFVYDDYGKWWQESLQRYHNVGVFPDFISIQNEPDCDPESYACMMLNPTETPDVASYSKALAAVYGNVSKMEHAPKFVGPENLGIGWNQTQDYTRTLDKRMISGYAFHYYHSGVNGNDRYSHPNEFIESMRGLATDLADKPMFMTENSQLRKSEPIDGMYTAWFIANAFNINKVSYYTHWNLIWGTTNDGCITLQKWDSVYAQPYDKGFRVNTEYHGLRHFSKFVRPGMNVIGTWATNNQMTTCGFMMPDSSAFTVVIINQGDKELAVDQDLDLDSTAYTSQVVLSVPEKGIFSNDLGAYKGAVTMPAHSIVTIAYKKITHVKAPYYIFAYNEDEHDSSWNNVNNWTPSYLPWSTDTIILRKGDCKVGDIKHEAPITIEPEACMILTGNVDIASTLTLNGGSSVRVADYDADYTLSCDSIHITQPANIVIGGELSRLTLNTPISTEATVQKVGPGRLRLAVSNPNLIGDFKLRDGAVEVATSLPFGETEVEVMGKGQLVIDSLCSITRLMLQSDSTICLNHNLVVKNLALGGIWLPNGVYTKNDYPNFIKGDSAIYVNHPYPVIVKKGGDSIQTIQQDSAIIDIQYTWEYADYVDVDWNPHQPDGLSVDVVYEEQTVYFSGAPSESGDFAYSVSSVSIEDSVFVQNGLLSVIARAEDEDTTSLMSSVNTMADVIMLAVSPNPVSEGQKTTLTYNGTRADNVTIAIKTPSGVEMGVVETEVAAGRNRITLPNLPVGVYMVTVKHSYGMSTLKLLVR